MNPYQAQGPLIQQHPQLGLSTPIPSLGWYIEHCRPVTEVYQILRRCSMKGKWSCTWCAPTHRPTFKDILVLGETELEPDWGTGFAIIQPPPSTTFRLLKVSPDNKFSLFDLQIYEPCQHFRFA